MLNCILFCSGYKNRQIKRRTNCSLKGSFVSLLKICRHRESKINPFSSMQIEHLKQFSSGIADICDRIRRIHTNFRLLKSCTTFNIKSFFPQIQSTQDFYPTALMQEAPLIPNCNGDIYSRGMSYGLTPYLDMPGGERNIESNRNNNGFTEGIDPISKQESSLEISKSERWLWFSSLLFTSGFSDDRWAFLSLRLSTSALLAR